MRGNICSTSFFLILVIIITAIAILLTGSTLAEKLIASDDFTGINGNPPNAAKWSLEDIGGDTAGMVRP